jgi:hypothetical protein
MCTLLVLYQGCVATEHPISQEFKLSHPFREAAEKLEITLERAVT